jgi:chromosome segregation ATPase
LSPQGIVVNKRSAALTPEQYAAREAEQKRKKQEAIEAKEQARKDQALLSTYSSVKDIDDSWQRALKQPEQALKDIGKRIDELRQRARKLASDKKSYANNPIPRTLHDDINDNELDLKNHRGALAAKKKEINEINARFGKEKQRYLKITGAKPKAAAPAKD